jgi:hypothetical protein
MPDNYNDALDQAERNVNSAVRILIDGYKDYLDSQVEELNKGNFPQELQAEISDLQEAFKNNIQTALERAESIRKTAKDSADNTTISVKDLKDCLTGLSTEAESLKTLLTELRGKVQGVGNLSGKVLGTALHKFVTGVF